MIIQFIGDDKQQPVRYISLGYGLVQITVESVSPVIPTDTTVVTTIATFANWAEQAVSKKFVLVEMDVGHQQVAFHNERAGVWGHKFDTYTEAVHSLGHGNLGYGSLGGSGTLTEGNKTHPMSIGSVKADGTSLDSQGSIASVQSVANSYWYNYDTSKLYLHCTDHNDPNFKTVIVGFTMGLSNKAIHINNAYYEPRLLGIPVLRKTKDPLYYGLIKHDGGSFSYENSDGFFDRIGNDYLFGQSVVARVGGNYANKIMPYENYRKVFTGYIDNFSIDWNTMTTDVVHNIKRLSKIIPIRKYETTTFPNLNADDIGTPRPIAYGQIYHAACVCVNKDETSQDWVFECADTTDHASGIMSVTAAYKDGVTLAIKSQGLASGTFTVSAAAYTPLATDRSAVITADFSGFDQGGLITNACDVIKDIMTTYASITYNSTNYDTTEWEAEDDDALNCALFINEEIGIEEAIEKLTLSSFGSFIEKDDGRYTFRIVDTTIDSDETIGKDKIKGSPEVPHDSTKYLSSCKVGYSKNWDKDTYRWYNDTTDESDIATKYGKYEEKHFETLLTTVADAITFAGRVRSYLGKVAPEFIINVPIEFIDFEIGDIKSIETDRFNSDFMGTVKSEIIEITKNIGLKDEPDYLTVRGRKCD